MCPGPEETRSPVDAFVEAFLNAREAETIVPLVEYLTRFPGDEKAIARKYLALVDGESPVRSTDHVSHYRKIRQIGRGGQGTVYLAEDVRLHRQVALKIMDPGFASDAIAVERFKREAEITSKLDHPGICTVYETGEDRGSRWIAMRYLDGESLAKKVATAKEELARGSTSAFVPLMKSAPADDKPPASRPPDEAIGPQTWADISRLLLLFEEAARTLHAAHEVGVIHRDIKPGNMMVTTDGKPVILDFGLAVDTDSDLPTLTMTGDLMGTKEYMSPEQIAAHRIKLDRRTDVYSLGVSLFECLALRRPFEAPTREGLYEAIMTKAAPDLRRLNPALPADLRVVVATAMEKERDRRYQTALDFAEDLRRIRMHEPIVAKPVGPLGRLQRWSRRNRVLATTSLALLVFIIATLIIVALFISAVGAKDHAVTLREYAEQSAAIATARSLDWERLADGRVLENLIREADTDLWPARPERVPPMVGWLQKAGELASRLPAHRMALEMMKSRAKPYDEEAKKKDRESFVDEAERLAVLGPEIERLKKVAAAYGTKAPGPEERQATNDKLALLESEQRELEAKVGQRLTWQFDLPADQLKHDNLASLVKALAAFLGDTRGDRPTLKDVADRLEFARTIRKKTIDDYARSWRDTIASIARSPIYRGLSIKEQIGLIPLGPDPKTGLFEFSETQTGVPARRDADGCLVMSDETALVLVLLPGGAIRIGAQSIDPDAPNYDPDAKRDEGPVHELVLSPFLISKYEMTQGQWLAFTGRNPSLNAAGRRHVDKIVTLRNPVEQVSWNDCTEVCRRLGLMLPTEAQWEYAARAGTATAWWCGSDPAALRTLANLADQSLKAHGGIAPFEDWDDGYATHAPIGTFPPNPFGLHEVIGNVWEWCRDAKVGYDTAAAQHDGLRGSGSPTRIIRGGSLAFRAASSRSATRGDFFPGNRTGNVGLRPARRLDP
jgi:serine/threonine protein kinase/formylglycine-generating enzyme required for sulfatase activity